MAFKRHRHYGNNIVLAYLILCAVLFLVPFPKPPEPFNWILVALLIGGFVAGQVAFVRHDFGHLCEECIATMPLNPQAKADRNKLLLRVCHQMFGTFRRAMIMNAIQIVLPVACLTSSFTVGPPVSVILTEAALLLMVTVHLTKETHRRYGPWCPYCRDGGGGGGARAEAPDPTIPQPA